MVLIFMVVLGAFCLFCWLTNVHQAAQLTRQKSNSINNRRTTRIALTDSNQQKEEKNWKIVKENVFDDVAQRMVKL